MGGSPVFGSAISVLFRCFCRWQSVLFSVRSAPDIPVSVFETRSSNYFFFAVIR